MPFSHLNLHPSLLKGLNAFRQTIDGNLDELISALTTYYTAEKLREVTEAK